MDASCFSPCPEFCIFVKKKGWSWSGWKNVESAVGMKRVKGEKVYIKGERERRKKNQYLWAYEVSLCARWWQCKKEIIIIIKEKSWGCIRRNVWKRESRTNDSSALPSPIWPLAVKPSLGYRTVTLLFKRCWIGWGYNIQLKVRYGGGGEILPRIAILLCLMFYKAQCRAIYIYIRFFTLEVRCAFPSSPLYFYETAKQGQVAPLDPSGYGVKEGGGCWSSTLYRLAHLP